MLRFIAFVLLGCVSSAHAQQVYRCAGPGGQTVFQQAPCTGGSKVDVKPANVVEPFRAPTRTASQANETAASAPPPAIDLTPRDTRTSLQRMADTCLDWYRSRLRDPRGAYHSEASYENDILTMSLHATNGYGGYVVKTAQCEFRRGVLEEHWTKVQARRAGW